MNLNTPTHTIEEDKLKSCEGFDTVKSLSAGGRGSKFDSVEPSHGYKGRFTKFNFSAENACYNYNKG